MPPRLPFATIAFLEDLRQNNTREWFAENRHFYDHVIIPAMTEILAAIHDGIKDIFPDYLAIPKVNKSFYRINRDLRFGKDKSPYKTQFGMLIYRRRRKDSPFFYLHFAPEECFWTCGWYQPSPEAISIWREMVSEPKLNKKIGQLLDSARQQKYLVNEPKLKRMPREYKEARVANPELLRHKGIYIHQERPPGSWLEEEDWVSEAITLFRKNESFMRVMENWQDRLDMSREI